MFDKYNIYYFNNSNGNEVLIGGTEREPQRKAKSGIIKALISFFLRKKGFPEIPDFFDS